MKEILVTVAATGLLLIYAAVQADVKCPPSVGENATLIANPENCSTYYVCDRGLPVPMLCPIGLHFNDVEKICDWPANAACDPRYSSQQQKC